MSNNGRDYEQFVRRLQQALLDSESFIKQKNVRIEANKIFVKDNRRREFDLYWEYEYAGITYKTVIECKDYSNKISIEKIDALVGKMQDFPDLKAVFATKTGYQSGAESKAKENKIDLLIVREASEADWQDKDGKPYIKGFQIAMFMSAPARITDFSFVTDDKRMEDNAALLPSRNDLITIENNDHNDKYTLLKLEERLRGTHLAQGEFGAFEKKQKFDDAYIYCGELKLKLKEYKICYHIPRPVEMTTTIDYSKELIGVIEYLHKDTKTAVFSDRVVKNWD